ncbi:MAG: TIM barrel protein [Asgard group archaeon]|nr:TIM barrel protein [Asgard group archaeon]
MKLGMTIQPFKGIPASKFIPFARVASLDHLEINPKILPEIPEILPKLKPYTTTFHLPIYGIEGYDFGSKSKKFEKNKEIIIKTLNSYKAELNLLYTLAHPPEAPDSSKKRLLKKLAEIKTPIILENIPGQTDEDFLAFYNEAKDYLGSQLAGHAIDGPHRYLTYKDKWLDIPEELLNEIVYIHITDCTATEDSHLALGLGKLPFNDFFTFLKDINYVGVINQEIVPRDFDLGKILDSCLYCVKPFSKGRYFRLKIKYSIIKPFLRQKLKKMEKMQND